MKLENKSRIRSFVSYSIGLAVLLLSVLLTIKLNRISNSTGASIVELGVILAVLSAIGYSVIFFLLIACFKTKDICRKKITLPVVSFLSTLVLVYFSIGFWNKGFLPGVFSMVEDFILWVCLVFAIPLLIIIFMIIKNSNTKERYFIVSEIILLGIATPFIAEPVFTLGFNLFSIFVGLYINDIIGYLLIFLLIFFINGFGFLTFKFIKLKYSIFFKILFLYLLLIVNIGYFAAFIAAHIPWH